MISKKFMCDLKQVEGSKRRLKFIASTSAPDRDLDEISVSGWQLDNYMRNPVVLLSHNYNSIPIARTVSLNKDVYNDRLDAVIEFPDEGIYDVADTVYNLAKAGFINAVSVGFVGLESTRKPDGGKIYTKQDLLEISICGVPANPQALQVAMSKGIVTAKQVKMLQDNQEIDLSSIEWPLPADPGQLIIDSKGIRKGNYNPEINLDAIEWPLEDRLRWKQEKQWAKELEKDMRRN